MHFAPIALMKGTRSMSFDFNCIATGIGSLPVIDPDQAAAISLQYLPEAPAAELS
jgi:hypothetical protein